MLTSDETIRIYNEAVNGKEPTIRTPEAMEYRKKMDAEVAAMRKTMKPGEGFDTPHEF